VPTNLHDTLHYAIVRVGALVHAHQPLESRITRHSQRDAVLRSKLFQLGHNAIRDTWDRFRVKAVHHRLHELKLVLYRKVYEIRINDDVIRWPKSRIVPEEK
jgi:hypothetical protein